MNYIATLSTTRLKGGYPKRYSIYAAMLRGNIFIGTYVGLSSLGKGTDKDPCVNRNAGGYVC